MMLERIKNLVIEEQGQGMTEYAFILVLVVLVGMLALGILGGNVQLMYNKVNSNIN